MINGSINDDSDVESHNMEDLNESDVAQVNNLDNFAMNDTNEIEMTVEYLSENVPKETL